MRQIAQLVKRLRDDVVPSVTNDSQAAVYVSGLNPAFIDIADRIMQRLPLFLLYIIGVTFIVLAIASASSCRDGGDHDHPVGVHRVRCPHPGDPGGLWDGSDRTRQDGADRNVRPADRIRDPLRAVDDYFFLASRIREEHVHGLPTREAVEHGIAAIGRVIIAAAIIMAMVFSAFILRPPHLEGVRPAARIRDPH